jgi:hypothetical protein
MEKGGEDAEQEKPGQDENIDRLQTQPENGQPPSLESVGLRFRS